jgi:glycerol-3-phosphate dehydrogenase
MSEDSMPSKNMVPEQEIAELSDEMVRRLALKDEEIAALTEQRDRAMAVVEAARAIEAESSRNTNNYIAFREALAALQSEREAAAAEARRAAIEECAQWHRNQYREERGPEYGLASEAERKAWRNDNQWHLSCADAIEELASPAPQEETR